VNYAFNYSTVSPSISKGSVHWKQALPTVRS